MNTLKNYIRQPSTWLGLAKLGAAFGLYSTGIGGAIASVIMGLFGLVDVIRNERGQPQAGLNGPMAQPQAGFKGLTDQPLVK
jgi:hypothetical protein